MTREKWLKKLKPGNKVANLEYDSYTREKYYTIYEVKNITKKGSIRLTNGILLDEQGSYHKYENWTSTTYNIEPMTFEIIESIKYREKYSKLKCEVVTLHNKFNHMEFSMEDLKTLKEVFERSLNQK